MPTEFDPNTQDTFPFIESAIRILDDNLNWWKANYKRFEKKLESSINSIRGNVIVEARFIIYTGPDEDSPEVKRSTPAIKYSMEGLSFQEVEEIFNSIGDSWEGHSIFHHDEDIIILFE